MSEEYMEHQHQTIIRQRDSMEEMQKQLAKYRAALLLINEWKLPYKDFGTSYGSNGERDYFREVARIALT